MGGGAPWHLTVRASPHIAKDGLRTGGSESGPPRAVYGRGVYCPPEQAEGSGSGYYDVEHDPKHAGQSYKMKYWVVPKDENKRPYGILMRELSPLFDGDDSDDYCVSF